VVHNAHLQTLAPQLEVAIMALCGVDGGSVGERKKGLSVAVLQKQNNPEMHARDE
jgi:hypothetical protein